MIDTTVERMLESGMVEEPLLHFLIPANKFQKCRVVKVPLTCGESYKKAFPQAELLYDKIPKYDMQ